MATVAAVQARPPEVFKNPRRDGGPSRAASPPGGAAGSGGGIGHSASTTSQKPARSGGMGLKRDLEHLRSPERLLGI